MNKKLLYFLFILALDANAKTNDKVTNPIIESIEIRGDMNDSNFGESDKEVRFNFNDEQASSEIKSLYNEYLKMMSKQSALETELENSKAIISYNLSYELYKELNYFLRKSLIINTRDIELKYKENLVKEDLKLVKLEINHWESLLEYKGIKKYNINYKIPNLEKIKSLSYTNSMSAKMLNIEKKIISFEQDINSGVQFLSLTSNNNQENGIKYGYAIRFGDGAKDSFKKIKDLRQINSNLRRNEIKFLELKHNFSKAILKYNHKELLLKSSLKRSKRLKDKNLILSELYSLISLTKQLYSYKLEMLENYNEFIAFWGEDI